MPVQSAQINKFFLDNWSHTNDEEEKRAEKNYRDWLELNESSNEENVMLFSSVNEVHKLLQKLAQDEQLQVLVTGSLHLVGAFLSVLNSQNMTLQ